MRRFGPEIVQFLVAVLGDSTYTKYGLNVPVPHPDAPTTGHVSVHTMPDLNVYLETTQYTTKMASTVQRILQQIKQGIWDLYLLPSDVMCMFPVVNTNPFARILETEIHVFWCNTVHEPWYRRHLCEQDTDSERRGRARAFFASLSPPDDCRGTLWAYLHTSEGQSIDLRLSEHTTRLVSYHSAQVDGRKMVFTLQLSHQKLQLHDRDLVTDELKLLSLLNVSLSRVQSSECACTSNAARSTGGCRHAGTVWSHAATPRA